MDSIRLIDDESLTGLDGSKKDGLNFETYAEVLGKAAVGTRGQFAIGVFGEWGTGKTSLMRLTQAYLNQLSGVQTVWFNAWRFEQDVHPIIPLIATIIRALKDSSPIADKLSGGGSALINALRAIAYGFSGKAEVELPGLAKVEAAFSAKDSIDRSEKIASDPLLDQSLYYAAFEKLSAAPLPTDTRLIIFVDDLDRCFPESAIKILESIKLVLSQPGFVFVLGVARKIIEAYLEMRYKNQYGIQNFQAYYYLDKIIQLPFYIPPHRGRMEKFSTSLLEELEDKDKEVFREILPIIGAACESNPRATIRFVNNLLIDRAINIKLAQSCALEEIPLGYFAITRSLQQRWINTFETLMSSDDLCEKLSKFKIKPLNVDDFSSDEEKECVESICMDVDLRRLLIDSDPGNMWLANNNTRSSAIEFLKKERDPIIIDRKILLIYSSHDKNAILEVGNVLNSYSLTANFLKINEDDYIPLDINNIYQVVFLCFGPDSCKEKSFLARLEAYCAAYKDLVPRPRLVNILLPGSAPAWRLPIFAKSFSRLDLSNGINEKMISRIFAILSSG